MPENRRESAQAIRTRRAGVFCGALAVLMACAPVQGTGNSAAGAVGVSDSGTPAAGLPRNPQRPFRARNCAEAEARLAEAEAGSPMISDREMAQVLAQAQRQVERLCPSVPGADN